jgi:hypothetical protein
MALQLRAGQYIRGEGSSIIVENEAYRGRFYYLSIIIWGNKVRFDFGRIIAEFRRRSSVIPL